MAESTDRLTKHSPGFGCWSFLSLLDLNSPYRPEFPFQCSSKFPNDTVHSTIKARLCSRDNRPARLDLSLTHLPHSSTHITRQTDFQAIVSIQNKLCLSEKKKTDKKWLLLWQNDPYSRSKLRVMKTFSKYSIFLWWNQHLSHSLSLYIYIYIHLSGCVCILYTVPFKYGVIHFNKEWHTFVKCLVSHIGTTLLYTFTYI